MKIIRVNDTLLPTQMIESHVVTIGFFDGVHIGHQYLLNTCIDQAKKSHCKSLVITFSNACIQNLKHTYNLCMESNKLLAMENMGIDEVFLIEETSSILQLTAKEFIDKILLKLQIKKFICGPDFCFGKDLKKYDLLEKYFDLEIVNPLLYQHQKISSSLLKHDLEKKDVQKINAYLYYPYHIKGKIIVGKKLGHTIGFPTANVEISYLPLKDGVYFGQVYYASQWYLAMINVGINPTTDHDHIKKLEVYILDFNKNIYGEEIEVYFINYYRKETQFDSINALKQQLENDKLSLKRHKIKKYK